MMRARVLWLLVTLVAVAGPARADGAFLNARGTALYLGGKPFRNVGANLPDLFERFLHGQDDTAARQLADAHAAGIRFVRCFGSTWGSADFHLFEDDRARWLAAYDRMLAAAHREGIAVVPSLLFNANMVPDYVRAKTGRDERIVDLLTPGTASNDLAIRYVTAIVFRYRDDPRVLFWEIGNEYNLEADLSAQWKRRPANQIPTSDRIRAFLAQMGALIKRLDPHHLVTSGNADMRPYAWHIRRARLAHRKDADPFDYPMDWRRDTFEQYVQMTRFFNPAPLDIVSVHLYPTGADTPGWLTADDTRAQMLTWARKAADRLGLPLFVGEFAQKTVVDGREQPAPWTLDLLRQMRDGAAPIAAVWAWEYDEANPSQSPYALSPGRTPALVSAIRNTNAALARPARWGYSVSPPSGTKRRR